MYDQLLAVPVFLPVIGGFLVMLLGRYIRWEDRERMMSRIVELLVLANSLLMGALILASGGRTGDLVLFRLYGQLTVMFRLDRMGSVFAGLVSFLWPLATLYAFEYMEHEKRKSAFFGFYTVSYGVTLGVALAGNLVTMYIFYEMLTFATFPLVLHPMTTEAARATRQYLYYSIGGAAFAFLGLVFVLGFSAVGTTEFVAGGMLDLAAVGERRNQLLFIYVLAFFGFGVKAALFPCHGWLPKAAVAPTPVTALLHAVAVVKAGAFAVLRFTYFSFGTEFLRGSWAQWVVMAASLVTIAYASTRAVREVHWKRRLAYSTISNLSYILFGASLMSPMGLAAALSHLLAHAFMKISAFFCCGAVTHQTGKTYIYQLDGMGRRMPVTFACFTVCSLSLMGIPLFAGFVSKYNLCQAAFSLSGELRGFGSLMPAFGVIVILYSALMTGIYMMTVVLRAYFPQITGKLGLAAEQTVRTAPGETGREAGSRGNVSTAEKTAEEAGPANQDPSWKMLVPLLVFSAAILYMGMHFGPLMRILTAIGGETA